MAIWKFEHFVLNLSARYLVNCLSLGLETWSADRGLRVDYLIKLKKIHLIFPELWPFENLGILNLSAIYLKNYLS